MKKILSPFLTAIVAILFTAMVSQAALADAHFTSLEAGEVAQGGDTTHYKKMDANAFSHPAANMPFKQQLDFKLGNGIFKKLWVAAPSSTTASDGLGPLYNARSCMQCHIRDGRGHTPKANWPDDNAVSLFLRLSIPAQTDEQRKALAQGRHGVIPEPTYGTQLQDFAVSGLKAEGRMNIRYSNIEVQLSGGERVTLRRPEYSITDLQYGPAHPDLMISPRMAPAMIGLGLLENIAETDIRALSDPEDSNNDGISGRPNIVWNQSTQSTQIGRFGWKAGHPTLDQQNNAAFNGDIGISTPYIANPFGDCTERQTSCLQMANGNTTKQEGLEASSKMNEVLLFYTRHIAVPARRQADNPEVLAGKNVFYQTGCQHCHQPSFVTADNPQLPKLSNQRIWPYSDLLLHDMGEGLADNRPEFQASGREWRTAPLWGIGLMQKVSGQANYLHDGRARSLLEAILWHGGEAEQSMLKVKNMPVNDRNNLIKFLESL